MKQMPDLTSARDSVLNEEAELNRRLEALRKGAEIFRDAYLSGGSEAGTKAIEELLRQQDEAKAPLPMKQESEPEEKG